MARARGESNGRNGARAPSSSRVTGIRGKERLRFAVVGAGHIAQKAVLPAFANAKRTCELTAIVSDDPKKQRALARQYQLDHVFGYEVFDEACRSGIFDAVYIALPNSMHRDFTERAAAAGIHVLCEKPMATSAADCMAMIEACRHAGVKLMIAYRLHFEAANLEAVRLARTRKLGELRLFHSAFTMQAREGNIRLDADLGGGPLMDIGIYCINAARSIFGAEPTEVSAIEVRGDDPRFGEVEEAVSAVLRFPGDRLATFTCSFGAADAGWYQVIGTKGDLVLNPAYEYQEGLESELTLNGRKRKRAYKKRDQFAPELIYFADCVRRGIDPEPGGLEGLIDVRIIEAIKESSRTGERVLLERMPFDRPPDPSQHIRRPPPRKKSLVNAVSGHR